MHQIYVHTSDMGWVRRVKQEMGTSTILPKYCKIVLTGIRYIMGNGKIVHLQYRNEVNQGIQEHYRKQEVGTWKTGLRYIKNTGKQKYDPTAHTRIRYIMENRKSIHLTGIRYIR